MSSLKNSYYRNLKNQSFVLKWLLSGLLENLPYQSVLDIGGSIGLAKKYCMKSEVKTVFSIDPDRDFIESFLECSDDSRFNILEENIDTVDLTKFKYDIAFFLLNLPWLTDVLTAIEKVAFNAPKYIVIADQKITPDQQNIIGTDMPEVKKKINNVFKKYISRGICIDDLMVSNGYYPLIVLSSNMLKTVLYTKDKPDRTVYDKAKYIIQVNSSCNFDCPWCYVDKLGITMDEDAFHKILETVNEKDMISLRGGEPTLSPNLISGYITPAIDKGVYVILESNGSFIGRSQYDDYLNAFSNKDAEIRLSLDRPHLDFLSSYEKRLEHLDKMERFIEDARKYNINFGLYSLGMDMKQISTLLEEFSLMSISKFIRPITRYLDIKDLPIKGKFVDIYGNFHDRISVDYWGAAVANGGYCITLRDLARFSQMVLDDGFYNGQQIIESGWIDNIRFNGKNSAWKPTKYGKIWPDGFYRNQWYITKDDQESFFAIGVNGQHIWINPTNRVVIVKYSSWPISADAESGAMTISGMDAIARQLGQK